MSTARLTAVVAIAALAGACGGSAVADDRPPTRARPARPPGCVDVAGGTALAAAIAAAPADGALCLAPGRYPGPITIDRPLAVWGPADAVLVSSGSGTTVRLTAPGARLLGVTVDGSGGRYDKLDGAVLVAADRVTVEGVTIQHAVYGLLVEKARHVTIRGNHVRGGTDPSVGLRGDTIRLWETHDSEVIDNLVEDGRDMVVWYSRGNHIAGNHILRGRYGTHFMYSHDSVVVGNHYRDVTVGVFVMYSHDVSLRGNLVANAAGAAGIAIGLKDSGTVEIVDNLLVRDQVGLYLDATPQGRGKTVTIRGNQLRLCRTAVVFHASGSATTVTGNDFAGNEVHARVDGGGDALAVDWTGNYFDDYVGYDLDGDGQGDVPYQARSLAASLTDRHPNLGFFTGTPALALADATAKLDPLFQPRATLVDPRPRMHPVATAAGRGAR